MYYQLFFRNRGPRRIRYCGSESRTVEFVGGGKSIINYFGKHALSSTKALFNGKLGACVRESCRIQCFGLVVVRGKAGLRYESSLT